MKPRLVLWIPVALLLSTCLWALSPPQYALERDLKYSFGANPCVDVSDVKEIDETHYEIDVTGCREEVATALAAILVTEYKFGGIRVKINVLDPDGNVVEDPLADHPAGGPHQIRGYFEAALKGNCFFSRTRAGDRHPLDMSLWVEIKKKIIQFWNDDLRDLYGNTTDTARNVFLSLVKTSFETNSGTVTLGFSTKLGKNCQ